jgi:hypothetical protein
MLYDTKWDVEIARAVPQFLSAAELRISGVQRSALIQTLDLLEGGRLPFIHTADIVGTDTTPSIPPTRFSMAHWHCGTVACIGGTAAALADNLDLFYPQASVPVALRELFQPYCGFYAAITVDHAVQALRNYLTIGTPRWGSFLPERFHYEVVE